MTSDWVAPQSTLKGMADAADAIVVGSIVSERFHLSETCFPSTLVTVAVDSVIKDHPRAASADGRLVAWRTGGKRREENIVVRLEEDQFPSFKLGEKYLLLLSWNEIRDRWYVGTPYRTLKVQGSVLTPVADYGPLAASGRGKELVVFAEQLRKIIARR